MSAELKSCPLCGSAFKIGQEPRDNHPVAGKFYLYHDYGPLDSAARKCPIEVRRHFDTEAEAIAAWNTRTAHSGEGREDVDYWNEVAQRLGHESVCEALEKLAELQDAGEGRSNGAGEWQPIDTAPKDGSDIIAVCATAYTPTAFETWWQDGWTHCSRPDEKWHGGVGKWFPTHWMPKPVFPALSAPQGEMERLREALAKRTFLTCVSGDGPTPYLKVHFNNLSDAHAAQDELLGRKS